MKKSLSAVLLSAALLSACGDDSSKPSSVVDEEGCEHLQKGPGVSLSAVREGTGPAVSNDHKRYDIALQEVAGGKGGAVSFAVTAAEDYVLFTNVDVPVTVTTSGGQVVEAEAHATSSESCTDIRGRHVVPLGVGTHTLTFGPTTVGQVSLVIEESGEHEHAH
ncbi:hypothetical protein KRR26_14810 [Corallococcus sp. M34]|uniref:hypothetical protein n=1 Tax=Citreicoccus inhibens TaxID=2849499 RepID=UPI001C20FF65|nr:hypothetical protein [Citreicoccus inhibens]MBU8896887.1 hypothetical protein [Citreicoccus inhibens]